MCTNVEQIISKYGEQIKLTQVLLMYIYIYMHIDKASEKKRNISTFKKFCALYIYIYIYIYIFI